MQDLIGLLTIIVFSATLLCFFGLIWWRIFAKAGHRGALGLLMLVPFVNLVMLCVLAFGKWPIQRQMNHMLRLLPPEHKTVFDER
jgi:hypothetical protein